MAKRLDALLENVLAEPVAQEHALAQTQRVAFTVKRLDIECGIGPSDGKADGVGASVDRGDVNRLGHSLRLPPEMRERGGRRVLRRANSQSFADALPQLLVHGRDAGF